MIRERMLSRLPILLVATVMLFASGCGTVRYVYSQLDWLVPWYVRDYVRLTPAQQALLDERLAARLAWHCESELPRYVDFLHGVEADFRRGEPDLVQLEGVASRLETKLLGLAEAIVPDLAALLPLLDDEQIAYLAQRFDERNEETREKFLVGSDEALHLARVERMEKRLRRWFGRLDTQQQARVVAWSQSLKPTTQSWFDNRVARQDRLLAALEARADPVRLEQQLVALLIKTDEGIDEAYRLDSADNRRETLMLLADLYRSASSSQRERIVSEFASLANQFDRLSCSAS